MVTMNIAAITALSVIVQLTSILKIKDIGMVVEMNQKSELFLLENDLLKKLVALAFWIVSNNWWRVSRFPSPKY